MLDKLLGYWAIGFQPIVRAHHLYYIGIVLATQ